MAQVFVDDPAAPELDDEDAHHLLRVLRLRPGEIVIASDGRGSSARCRFTGAGALLEPEGAPEYVERPAPALTVAFAPVKGDRPEWVVQKLTELGVDRIMPITTERSVVRWPRERGARAADRLRKVAREAAAQSRRAWLPEVGVPRPLSALVAEADEQVALAEHDGGPPTLRCPSVAVGPEGGWSEAERSLGLPAVRLGDATLRAETAAVAAGVVLSALRAGLVGAAGTAR
ncbi:MAG TPA: RsmE family RNA methyltransferase [Acidimicrobiia bacterium]|nr:RsmE family RNA methyltransferase [Acidimicrobiia bacterium]